MQLFHKLTERPVAFFNMVRRTGFFSFLAIVFQRMMQKTANSSELVNLDEWLQYYLDCKPLILSANMDGSVPETPKVSIIVLTHNNLLINQLCLASIYCNTTYRNFEVIVVDNGSTDGTVEWLKSIEASRPNLRLILNMKNLGFAGGNNQAARVASGDYLIFLNNDTVVTKGLIRGLLKHLQNRSEIGLIGPVTNAIANEACIPVRYTSPQGMEEFAERLSKEMKGRSFEIRMLAFYCVMARRVEFLKLGGLDERYAVGMFEDDDISVSFRQQGFKIVCADDVFVHHFHRSSFGKLSEEKHHRLFTENRKKYEEKWAREWLPYRVRDLILDRQFAGLGAVRRYGASLRYRCNICGRECKTPLSGLGRETPSCRCGSTVRTRSIIHILSMELFGKSLALPDFPVRRDLAGWGMSDSGYVDQLTRKLNYINTFYHKEPRLDITGKIDPNLEGGLDFIISTEVFEHIMPPVSVGFRNIRCLLKPGGVLIFSVPYTLEGETREHFPELYEYEIIQRAGRPVLKNTTRDGREQVFEDLVFHGGPGSTLEMRVFSKPGLLNELEQAGFSEVKIYSEPCWEFGIYWHESWSLPVSARVRKTLS